MAGERCDIVLRQCVACSRRHEVFRSDLIYEVARWREAILQDTPREVWDEYRANGIPLMKAVEMEMSYAG